VLLRQNEPGRFEPRFCTAVVALVSGGRPAPTVTLAVGGHPLPVLRPADGRVTTVGSPGSLIGALAAAPGDARSLAGAVEQAVLSFATEPPSDDLAVLVLRAAPTG